MTNKYNQFDSSFKTRNWAFLVYPDSAPKFWLDYLIQTGAEFCISPLHDKDVITESDYEQNKEYYIKNFIKVGDKKKPHYHIILCCNGPTTQNHIKKLTSHINATNPFPLISVYGYWCYLIHDPKEYPDKVPYNMKDRKGYNGFNVKNYIELSGTQVFKIKNRIIQFIIDNKIHNIADVIEFFMVNNFPNELQVIQNNYNLFKTYIDGRWHRKENKDFILRYNLQNFEDGTITEYQMTPHQLGINEDDIFYDEFNNKIIKIDK